MKEKTRKQSMANSKKAETAVAKKEIKINPRGRFFEWIVKKKFSNRVSIEFERMNYVKKYERYTKSKTKIHARLPATLEKEIKVGDLIKIQECRPLSKIIHFIVIKKVKDGEEKWKL